MCFFKKVKLKGLLKKAKKLHDLRDSGGKSNIQQEATALMDIARFYDKNRCDEHFPHAKELALEYYRAAAILENSEAQYICSQRFLERGKFWEAFAADT